MNHHSINYRSHPQLRGSKSFHWVLLLYFVIAFMITPISIYHMDSYYYWEWSRHLSLSYYDGSPMIAYLIKLTTLIFGDNLMALGTVSVGLTGLTTWFLYKTARLFLDKPASQVATLLWLFAPLTTLDLLHQVTYDNPQALFWTLALYFVIRYLRDEKTSDLYGIGFSCGMLLLSKYTGVVLILSMLIFLIISKYRRLFLSIHFHLACLLIVLIFSPVLIWNYQHQWVSFIYQLTTHNTLTDGTPLWNIMRAIGRYFIPYLNALLVTPYLCWKKKYHKQSKAVLFCLTVSLVFLIFHGFSAKGAAIRPNWLAPYLLSTSLLAGYCYQQRLWQKPVHYLIIIYALLSTVILVQNNPFTYLKKSHKFAVYQLIQQFNRDYPEANEFVLTSHWLSARPFYFLNGKPAVYTLTCMNFENQYGFWSKEFMEKVRAKTVKKALYIDTFDSSHCAKRYFDQCRRLPSKAVKYGNKTAELYAYLCSNQA